MSHHPSTPSRREVLKRALAASVTAAAAAATARTTEAMPARGPAAKRSSNPVLAENERAGSGDWQLTRVGLDQLGGKRSPRIEGYCSRQSVEAGDNLEFKVRVDPGANSKLRSSASATMAARPPGSCIPSDRSPVRRSRFPRSDRTGCVNVAGRQAPSSQFPATGRRESISGASTLTEHQGSGYWQSYVIFIVRDRRRADILFQCSDNTWQAYNQWPDNYSLYTDPRAAHAPGVSVSFDRPYGKFPMIFEAPQSIGSGEFLLWEFPLCYWLERFGYDVTYCSNSDVLSPGVAGRAKVFLSVGHDEYWDLRQFEALRQGSATA
jgi:hypothetical protein